MRGLLKGKMLMVLNHFHCAKHFAIMYCAPFDTVCVCFTFSRFGVVFCVCFFFFVVLQIENGNCCVVMSAFMLFVVSASYVWL